MDAQASDGMAEQRAALRRVAMLAAQGAPPEEVFAAVAVEATRLLDADLTTMARYDAGEALRTIARWSADRSDWGGGRRMVLGERNVSTLVFETGRPARVNDYSQASGTTADVVRELGIRSSVGVPISVEGRLWGLIIVSSTSEDPLPADAEARLADFTELVGTAIANAQARVDLRGYAEEQAALRRVATLVAGGAAPEEVFAAVAAEAGRLLGTDLTSVARYDAGGVVTIGRWNSTGGAAMPSPLGTRTSLGGRNVATLIFQTRRPARIDDYSSATGALADRTRAHGTGAAVGVPITVEGRLWGYLAVAPAHQGPLPADAEARLADFTELVGTAIANAQARVDLRGYAEEQAALRRVATLVARAAPPEEVFAAVSEEVGRVLSADYAGMSRYDPDGTATFVGMWTRAVIPSPVAVGDWLSPGGRNVTALVHQTGQSARIDDYSEASDRLVDSGRDGGFRSAVGVPITVGDRLWGVMIVGSAREAVMPAGTEARLTEFTELAGTAIANAEAQVALAASRARLVTASDEARRRIERDLHDGAQQRLLTLALRLREAQATAPPGAGDLVKALDGLVGELAAALEELREIASGIHPAALADGGLHPALGVLARRSPVPVTLHVEVPDRLPGPVETAAYYVVCEALANMAKHARAATAAVTVAAAEGVLRVSVRDDGCGGADFGRGSGLVGLRDRVEALGGRITLRSPPGTGTTLEVCVPIL